MRPEVPHDLAAICLRALEKRREDRFQSAEEFALALEATERTSSTQSTSTMQRSPRARQVGQLAGYAMAALVGAGAAASVLWPRTSNSVPESQPASAQRPAVEPLGIHGAPEAGARLEAQQLAGYVVGPWQVDSTLTEPYLSTYFVIDEPGLLAQFGPESIATAAGRHKFIDGFVSARESATKTVLINGVLFLRANVRILSCAD